MTTHLGFLYRLEWHNPYTEPPPRQPRILAEMFVPTDGSARTPAELVALHRPGSGYVIKIQAIMPPPRQRKPDQLALTRRRRLWRRISERFPLLAKDIFDEEIAKKPEYYLNGVSSHDLERTLILGAQLLEIDRLTAHANTLIVYGEIP